MKNEYKITKKLIMSWAKEYHLQGSKSIFNFVLTSIMGICGLILLILNILYEGEDFFDWFCSIIFLIISVYLLFFSRFVVWSNRYNIYSKTYGVTEWMRTTEFTETDIIITDHTSVSKFKYENIKNIKEKNNVVLIFFNNNLAVRLYKDAFVEGSWDECKAFINSKI